jgi:K+-transporting ATPase c subunit
MKTFLSSLRLLAVLTLLTGLLYPLAVWGVGHVFFCDAAEGSQLRQNGHVVGSALLAVRRLIYDEDERPVQWLHGLYRPDRYTYEMQLSRVGSIDAKVWVSKDVSAQFN